MHYEKYLRLVDDWNSDSAEKGRGAEEVDGVVEDDDAIELVLTAGGGIGEANTGGWNVECGIPDDDNGGGVGCEGFERDVAGEWSKLDACDL